MPGPQGIAVLDGGKDRLVPRQGQLVQVGPLVGMTQGLAQRQRQHVAQVCEQVVVGGVSDAAVEIQIGLQHVIDRSGRFHALVGLADRCDLGVGGMLGGQRRCCRFDDGAHAGQQGEEFVLRRALHDPMQDVRVEHVPFTARLDHRAHPRLGIHQTLGHQDPGGFAQHRAADRILFTQQGFGGQAVVGLEATGDDLHPQFLDDPRVHAFAI